VTTVGVLGPPSRLADLNSLTDWADIVWGVDSVRDVVRHVSQSPVDVLVTEASVAYLTDELMRLTPHSIGQICAVAEANGVFEWAAGLTGVRAVRSFSDTRSVIGADPERDGGLPIVPGLAPVAETSPRDSAVIAVWGPVGAPGVTTTAISLSTVCAQAGLSTLLCDVDTRGSSVAIALGVLDETPGFAAACRLAGRDELTPSEIRRIANTVEHDGVSFSVLTGVPRASRWAEVVPEKVRPVLDLVREIYDVVIVDVGFGVEQNEWIDDAPQRDGAAREILRRADAVIAVGTPDAVGVSRIIRGLDEIRDLCESPIVVLNRAPLGSGADAADAIHRFSDHLVRTVIPVDGRRGIEEAMTRARNHPTLWRRVAEQTGVALPPTLRKSRWRR
jgi:MinD-like ATPase involved in chromosome partitioning or flagellar assembly